MTNSILHPALRFSEFSENWISEILGDPKIASFNKGKGISKANISENGQTECIRYGQLYTIYKEVIHEIASTTDVPVQDLVLSEINDVIIPSSGESQIDIATASCVMKKGVAIGGDLNIIRPSNEINGIFLSYYLNSIKKKEIARLAQGISVIHLYNNQLKLLKLNIPKPDEQEKIANFLIAVDKRINLLEEKKNQLEVYKKGIMQKIFSRTIRFKDDKGNDFSDWEEKKAKEVFYNHSNKNHNGDLPILSASQEHGMIYRDGSGIDIQSSEKSVQSYKIVEPKDFVITLRSFQGGLDFSNIKGICSPAYTILKNTIPVNFDFYKFYFKKESFIGQLNKITVGIRDGKQITYQAFGSLRIPYPSIDEQQKISLFLSSLNNKQEVVSKKIGEMIAYKHYLLQKMFV